MALLNPDNRQEKVRQFLKTSGSLILSSKHSVFFRNESNFIFFVILINEDLLKNRNSMKNLDNL